MPKGKKINVWLAFRIFFLSLLLSFSGVVSAQRDTLIRRSDSLTKKIDTLSLKSDSIIVQKDSLIKKIVASKLPKDSLILKNGDLIVGEIKSLEKGIITVETDYSDQDFKIEWSGIRAIYSNSKFLLTLEDGNRINGTFRTIPPDSKILILDENHQTHEVERDDIVFFKHLKSDFWSRAKANIDIGLSITKANNLRQLSVRSAVGYMANRWQIDANYNKLWSKQDSIEDTRRTDAGIYFKYFLQNDWFLATSVNFLSNTEQALKLRVSGKVGGGKFIIHTNRSHWAAGAGLNFNHETFTNSAPTRSSLEGYAGTELNLFDIGDLNFLGNWILYKSFTESGRWRSDLTFDTKYDLPLDFYLKLGMTINYDNQPAVKGKETDYILQFTVGWEL